MLEICDGIFAKLESENAAGSTKDRVALQMINDAKESGKIADGATIVEATSGNTGIGLAAVAQDLGYKCKIFMPENMSKQRISLIESYGAQCILTAADGGMQASVDAANKYVRENENTFMADQFNNPSNWRAHYNTTGPEIFEQMNRDIDAFIAGIGTGGTITGVGKFLKEQNPDIKIIGVEPASSAVLSGGQTGNHAIQGIGAGFVPSVLDMSVVDEILQITDDEALSNFKFLNQNLKISAGISSGAAFCAAKKIHEDASSLNKIVVLFADGIDRYE